MTPRPLFCLAAVALLLVIAYSSYRAGAAGASARSAYVQSIALREEHKCVLSGDVECFRAHWHLRAGIVSGLSRNGLENTFPSGVEQELREFASWQEQIPPYRPPQRECPNFCV